VVEEASQPVAEQPEISREAPGDHNLCTPQEQRYTNEECSENGRVYDDGKCGPNLCSEGRIEQEETWNNDTIC
jgi:hypothetical protein